MLPRSGSIKLVPFGGQTGSIWAGFEVWGFGLGPPVHKP